MSHRKDIFQALISFYTLYDLNTYIVKSVYGRQICQRRQLMRMLLSNKEEYYLTREFCVTRLSAPQARTFDSPEI